MCFKLFGESKVLYVAEKNIRCYKRVTKIREGIYKPEYNPEGTIYRDGEIKRKKNIAPFVELGKGKLGRYGNGEGFHSFRVAGNNSRLVYIACIIPKGSLFYMDYYTFFSTAIKPIRELEKPYLTKRSEICVAETVKVEY